MIRAVIAVAVKYMTMMMDEVVVMVMMVVSMS